MYVCMYVWVCVSVAIIAQGNKQSMGLPIARHLPASQAAQYRQRSLTSHPQAAMSDFGDSEDPPPKDHQAQR